jgi:hypothetical protein
MEKGKHRFKAIVGALALGALATLPLQAQENADNLEKKVEGKSMEVAGNLGYPYLIAGRFVYGWDKFIGVQADLRPWPIYAAVDARMKIFEKEKWNTYGFLGGMLVEPVNWGINSIIFCLNGGAGVEYGGKTGFFAGAEVGAYVPTDLGRYKPGLLLGVNGGWRF